MTYTAKICDCTLDLIVFQPPLPTKRFNSVPSMLTSASSLRWTRTLDWHSPTQHHYTTTHHPGNFFQLLCLVLEGFSLVPLLLVRERPPRCISSFTEMSSLQQQAPGHLFLLALWIQVWLWQQSSSVAISGNTRFPPGTLAETWVWFSAKESRHAS